jgi:hypothetical protein
MHMLRTLRTPRSLLTLALLVGTAGLAAADAPAGKPAADKPVDKPADKPVAIRPAPPAPYAIAAIRAHMYFQDSGAVGTTDITDGKVALWNTIIGEGDASAPSSATLVYVELSGPTFANVGGTIEVVVTEGKKKRLKQKLDVGTYFNQGTKVVLPFFVYDTGCDELKVNATFTTPDKKKVKKSATVPFSCGE